MNRFVSALLLSFVSSYGLCQSQEGKCWQAAQAQTENESMLILTPEGDDDLNHVYRALAVRRKNLRNRNKGAAVRPTRVKVSERACAAFPGKEKQREYAACIRCATGSSLR
jgi:hypothetical protein